MQWATATPDDPAILAETAHETLERAQATGDPAGVEQAIGQFRVLLAATPGG